ncbi:MAG TPA: ABC transporter ATP-binding protein, partial [Methanocella sp.]|nr:ABC transporter ATP-binding protein [Methanocella sp.]
MSRILETKNVSFRYENGDPVLKDVSAFVSEGKKTVILGPNGSGKSTLLLHFNGVLRPEKGTVSFQGRDIKYDRGSLASLRQKVNLVFQNPDDQIFSATVEEDVAFGPLNLKLPRDEVEKRIGEALEIVDMIKFRDWPTQHLSFGQRKRVALAGALAMNPEVLIIDEPTAGLDAQMVHEMMELSEELNYRGKTVVICTHDIEMAYEWADEVLLLYGGEILYNGSLDMLFEHDGLLHRSRLTYPIIYKLNRQRSLRTGEPEGHIPHTIAECCNTFFRREKSLQPGKLYVVCIDDPGFNPVITQKFDRYNTGAFGTRAKREARETGLVMHYFHAIDQGLIMASLGVNFLLVTESALIDLVMVKLERFCRTDDSRIHVVRVEPEKWC